MLGRVVILAAAFALAFASDAAAATPPVVGLVSMAIPHAATAAQWPNGGSGGGSVTDAGDTVCYTSVATDIQDGLPSLPGPLDYCAAYSALTSPPDPPVYAWVGSEFTGLVGLTAAGEQRVMLSGTSARWAFESDETGIVPNDTNGFPDVFLRTPAVLKCLCFSRGRQFEAPSTLEAISRDGNYVLLSTTSNNVVAGDHGNTADLYRVDVRTGAIAPVDVTPRRTLGNKGAGTGDLSADGRFVAFASASSDLVPGDANGFSDVFLRDMQTGRTVKVSHAFDGGAAVGDSGLWRALGIDYVATPGGVAISADASTVVFTSWAENVVDGDANRSPDLFAWDRATNAIERVDVDSRGRAASGQVDFVGHGGVSDDGRLVVFSSSTAPFVASGAPEQVFLRDRFAGSTTLASVGPTGRPASTGASEASLSASGRYLVFTSSSPDLDPPYGAGHLPPLPAGVFLRDLRNSLGVTGVAHTEHWLDGTARGTVTLRLRSVFAGTVPLFLVRGAIRLALGTATVRVGDNRVALAAPKALLPGTYALATTGRTPSGSPIHLAAPALTFAAPPDGIVDRAYVSRTRFGRPVRGHRLRFPRRPVFVVFHFSVAPASWRRITVDVRAPFTRIARQPLKPAWIRRRRGLVSIQFVRRGTPLPTGGYLLRLWGRAGRIARAKFVMSK